MTDPELEAALRLAVAAGAGLAVGIEREWSASAKGPRPRFAGVRTFFLLGVLGGMAGWLTSLGLVPLGAVLLGAGGALAITAFMATNRKADEVSGATTEVAALVVLALGALAGIGYLAVSGGAAAVVVLALGEKERIRGFVDRIGERELQAALLFAVLALAVMPVLPDRSYGPYGGVSPRTLWIVVLLVSGLNFAGYIAHRAVGESRGTAVTGLLGGLVSSTLVTLTFARRSRRGQPGAPLAAGVLAASAVMLPRVLILTALLDATLVWPLARYIAPALALAAGRLVSVWRSAKREDGDGGDALPANPLRLWSAVKLALVFQATLILMAIVRQYFGARGVLGSAALVGLTSLDAVILSMSRLQRAGDMVELAATAIAIGILSNSLFKLGVVLAIGRGEFRRTAGLGLAASAAAVALGLWLF